MTQSARRTSLLACSTVLVTLALSACGDDSPGDSAAVDAGDNGGTPDSATPNIDAEDGCGALSHTDTVPLGAAVAATSQVAEYQLTAALAAVDKGDGTPGDADGLYNVANPEMLYGSPVDLFPRETAFQVGSLAFDASGLQGCGTETAPVSSLDLSELWTAGSGTADISDVGLALWFGDAPLSMAFGDLDAADQLTFEAGTLTSVDVSVPFSFTADYTYGAGNSTTYTGTLTLSGATFTLAMDDTQINVETFQGIKPESRLVFDITGTLAEVSTTSSQLRRAGRR